MFASFYCDSVPVFRSALGPELADSDQQSLEQFMVPLAPQLVGYCVLLHYMTSWLYRNEDARG